MNITINEKILDKYNLTIPEFLILYLCAKEVDIEQIIQNLINSGIVDRDLNNKISAVVSNNTKELITSVIVESDKAVINKREEFAALAAKLRELYPKGLKPGTTYQWRDSVPIIAKKLETVVAKFGIQFTEEEAINATQRYIDSFNGNYTFMHLLKYFILKRNKDTGDVESEFLSYLENPEETDSKVDWTSSLV